MMVYQLILVGSLLLLVSLQLSFSIPFSGVSNVGSDTLKSSDGTTIAMSSMARKAGGSWKRELVQKQVDSTEVTVKPEHSDEDDEYDEEEPECPRKMFYHIRGRRCVPLRCKGGNQNRNSETGRCTSPESFYGTSFTQPSDRPYRSPIYYTVHTNIRGNKFVKKVG